MSKWEMVKLGDVFKITSGGTPLKAKNEYYENGTIPWVKTGDLKQKFITTGFDMITEEGLNNSSAKLFPKGTVLIAMYGATIGACSILGIDASTNQACAALLPSEKVNNAYLYYFLLSQKEKLVKMGVGGAQPNISATILKNIEMPLPSLDVQEQIVDILDKTQEIINSYKKQLEELDNLIKATFHDMFGNLNKNDKRWEYKKFAEVATIDTKMTRDFNKYANVPHIGIDSIEKNTGEILEYKLVKDSSLISGKYYFNEQHIIYSKIRPNLNKVALPNFEGLCSADAYPILPIPEKANRHYLALLLRSDYFLNYILSHSTRTNIPKVNKQQLEDIKVILPPLDLQNKFAQIVTNIEEQKSLVKQSLTQSQNLFNSLMAKYFD
jgi:type I restriction enzyme, S subunit